MALRFFLAYLALVWTPYGAYCFLNPAILESFAGVAAQNATAAVELRAMYGGLQIAVGLSALLALLRPAFVAHALYLQLFVVGGLALSRSLAAAIDGHISGYTIGALAFEWSTVVLVLWFWQQVRYARI